MLFLYIVKLHVIFVHTPEFAYSVLVCVVVSRVAVLKIVLWVQGRVIRPYLVTYVLNRSCSLWSLDRLCTYYKPENKFWIANSQHPYWKIKRNVYPSQVTDMLRRWLYWMFWRQFQGVVRWYHVSSHMTKSASLTNSLLPSVKWALSMI